MGISEIRKGNDYIHRQKVLLLIRKQHSDANSKQCFKFSIW